MLLRGSTPLCPAGHLPHKGGEWREHRLACIERRVLSTHGPWRAKHWPRVTLPLVGEMPGRAEGGEPNPPPLPTIT
ncbi:MAG: hypothetical protein EON57_17070, partial [Alphaproteobacteria bacterium]